MTSFQNLALPPPPPHHVFMNNPLINEVLAAMESVEMASRLQKARFLTVGEENDPESSHTFFNFWNPHTEISSCVWSGIIYI